MINKIKFQIKKIFDNFNWKLFLALFAATLIPSIYKLVRFFIIGTLEGDNNYSIASQLMWVNLFYEVIQEFIILPIYYALAWQTKGIYDKQHDLSNKLKTGLIIVIPIYLVLAFFMFVFTKNLCQIMGVNPAVINQTIEYVRLETIAFAVSIAFTFTLCFLEFLKSNKQIWFVIIANSVLFILIDIFLLSKWVVSANLGINGIAISNMVVNALMFIIVVCILQYLNIKLFEKKKLNFVWVNEWLKKGSLTGLESLIRNMVFSLMVVRIANMVTEQGDYWMANNFIWQWLLLPTLSLAKLIQIELSDNASDLPAKSKTYFTVTGLFAIAWLITIPLWPYFLQYAMNYSNYNVVYKIVLMQTPFYLSFIFNNVMDATFLAKGKINYIVIQSVLINIVYYTIAFILFQTKTISYSLTSLSLMFGIGMFLDIIPTSIQYYIFRKQYDKKWIYKSWFQCLEVKMLGGRSTPNVTKLFNKIYRPHYNIHDNVNNFLLFLEKHNFNYASKFLGLDEQNRCVYSYLKGYVPNEIGNTNQEQLIEFIQIVKEFHTLSKQYNNQGKTYCHGDLSPCNTVFDKKNKPIAIIDWDSLKLGNRLEDVCYILWLWVNIGDLTKPDDIKIQELVAGIQEWELNVDEYADLHDAFINRMQTVVDTMSIDNPQYQKTIEWVTFSQKWIKNNWSKVWDQIQFLEVKTLPATLD